MYAAVGNLGDNTWTRPRLVHHGANAGGSSYTDYEHPNGLALTGPNSATALVQDGRRFWALDVDLRTNAWSSAQRLPVSAPVPTGLYLAANFNGDAVVAWTRCPAGDKYPCKLGHRSVFLASTRHTANSWTRPVELDESSDGGWTQIECWVGLDGRGNATVIWLSEDEDQPMTARKSRTGLWAHGILASSGFSRGLSTFVATDDAGDTQAVWIDPADYTDRRTIGAARWPPTRLPGPTSPPWMRS
jgi:hypothetical protein